MFYKWHFGAKKLQGLWSETHLDFGLAVTEILVIKFYQKNSRQCSSTMKIGTCTFSDGMLHLSGKTFANLDVYLT